MENCFFPLLSAFISSILHDSSLFRDYSEISYCIPDSRILSNLDFIPSQRKLQERTWKCLISLENYSRMISQPAQEKFCSINGYLFIHFNRFSSDCWHLYIPTFFQHTELLVTTSILLDDLLGILQQLFYWPWNESTRLLYGSNGRSQIYEEFQKICRISSQL